VKTIKASTLVLAFMLIIAPTLIARPTFGNPDSHYSVQPVAAPPLTNLNSSINGLEVPAQPSPVSDNFSVEIHLLSATGVSGVEVHFFFGNILSYATPTAFIDDLGTTGGVLTGPQAKLLYGVQSGFYDAAGNGPLDPPYTGAVEYKSAAASTGAAMDVTDGLVAKVTFTIIAQPTVDVGDQFLPLVLDFTDIVATSTKGADVQGMLTLHAAPIAPPPARAHIFVQPATVDETNGKLGDTVSINVAITANVFWDVAGYDVTFTYDPTLLSLVSVANGTFLGQGVYGFQDTSVPGVVHAVSTKLSDTTPSSGTGTLFEMTFQVINASTSLPPFESVLGLSNTDLASWTHPERSEPPWSNSITAVDLPFDNRNSPQDTPPGPALAWSHTTTNGTYTAPLQVAGALVDLYDQYPAPYGGQGPNAHSNAFSPQDSVTLHAMVSFGGDKIINKLVVFEVDNANGTKVTLLQNYTDSNGIATVMFRVPMTDLIDDPSVFGWWLATATVDVDQAAVKDTMAFQVGWKAQVTSVTANGAPYLKYSDIMNFTATLTTITEQPINVLVSIDAYDVSSYPIGEVTLFENISAARNNVNGPGGTTPGVFTYTVTMPIPDWTRVGPETVVGYALTALPADGGVALGPQSTPTPSAGIFTIRVS
jgi:hypothetical protein